MGLVPDDERADREQRKADARRSEPQRGPKQDRQRRVEQRRGRAGAGRQPTTEHQADGQQQRKHQQPRFAAARARQLARPGARPVDDDDHRWNQQEIGQGVGPEPGVPDLPVVSRQPRGQHDGRVEERHHQRGADRGQEKDEHVPEPVELSPAPPGEMSNGEGTQHAVGQVGDEQQRDRRRQGAVLELNGQVSGDDTERVEPPLSRRDQQEHREHRRVGQPEDRGDDLLGDETETDLRAQVISEGGHHRRDQGRRRRSRGVDVMGARMSSVLGDHRDRHGISRVYAGQPRKQAANGVSRDRGES